MKDFYVIVGLGNPGRQYQQTRHNVGFVAIEELSYRHNIKLNKNKFRAIFGEGNIGGKKVMLVQPQTYMNNSGEAVREIVSFYKVSLDKVIVIYDDIDLELGKLRIRAKGSAGTHNGMRSMIYHLKEQNFPRVRIGVGKQRYPGQALADHVVGNFAKEELPVICESVKTAADAIEEILRNGVISAMNKFN